MKRDLLCANRARVANRKCEHVAREHAHLTTTRVDRARIVDRRLFVELAAIARPSCCAGGGIGDWSVDDHVAVVLGNPDLVADDRSQ